MNRTFCDRCGGEIDTVKRPSLGVVKVHDNRPYAPETTYTHWDLCTSCTLSLAQWVML